MSDAPPLPEDLDAWTQERLRRQAAMLEQLAEAGLRMALAIERQVAEASIEPTEAAMAFARVARAVRLTALLQSKLLHDLARLRALPAANDSEPEDDRAERHKARVEAIVERVAKADTDDEDEIDRLVGECAERLDDEDIYGDVLDRPVGELVSLICRDLGLEPDWPRLADEAWAREEMDNPRSPFFATSPICGSTWERGTIGRRADGGEGGPHPLVQGTS